MSVELRPLGVKCNIQCQYCYQTPQRDAGNIAKSYEMGKMKSAIENEGGGFTLFGGEALLVHKKDLEELWSWGLKKFGRNSVQTNATLIDNDHIELFKRYKVHVGISIDGPGELNDVRWAGTLERTRAATEKTEQAIARLCQEGIPPSLIITLHKGNATTEKLPVMSRWFHDLDGIGISSARLHILEVDSREVAHKYMLSPTENVQAFLHFAQLEANLQKLHFDIFDDMKSLLIAEDQRATCVWNACDPYTTAAVRGVEGNGQSSNCGRTNKDGIDFVKSNVVGYERYIALFHTPQEYGGCQDCRFFLMCKGQCPGTSIDGDWRNRTEHCQEWKTLFSFLEENLIQEGIIPLSIRPDRPMIERALLETWKKGQNTNIGTALDWVKSGQTGSVSRYTTNHGDHNDLSLLRT